MEKPSDGKKLNNEAEDIRDDVDSSGNGGTDDW
jgi:hypothetical protein